MHLRECHNWAAQACRDNASELAVLFPRPLQQTARPQHAERRQLLSESHRVDLRYLADKIDKHAVQIGELKEVIIEQIELFDKRRNRTIGMFIAIYVPLAFATVRYQLEYRICRHGANQIIRCIVPLWYEHQGQLRTKLVKY